MLKIYNTQSRSKEVFVPIHAGKVAMYVCGMTIYDYCHVGHARMLVAFDVIQCWLRASNFAVTYVRNVTDIDDKIIRRAVENNEPISALTQRFTQYMHDDLTALGVQAPDHEPRATQYVSQMLSLIGLLETKGLAYQASSGDVNFSVRKHPGYGKLSGKSLDDLRAGERVAVTDSKEDPLDFVLWKSAKDSEPADAKWASQWGAGRPGWHIECSAMSTAILGNSLDIHGGGADLLFPHHENEIAQSEGAHGGVFARYWMHNGFVRIDDEKMSKSLNNFFTIRDVLKQYDAEVLRYFLMRAQYRSPINYSHDSVEDARAGLIRLYTSLSPEWSGDLKPDWTSASGVAFKEAMDDDFNTPIACAVLFDLASELNRQKVAGNCDAATERQLRSLATVLGLLQVPAAQALRTGLRGNQEVAGMDDAAINGLIAARAAAKHGKDFAKADALREQLAKGGVILEDSPKGTTWRRA